MEVWIERCSQWAINGVMQSDFIKFKDTQRIPNREFPSETNARGLAIFGDENLWDNRGRRMKWPLVIAAKMSTMLERAIRAAVEGVRWKECGGPTPRWSTGNKPPKRNKKFFYTLSPNVWHSVHCTVCKVHSGRHSIPSDPARPSETC